MTPTPITEIDYDALCARLRAVLPQLTYERVWLEHSDTRDRVEALSIETEDRQKDHVYRTTIAVFDGHVHVWAHVHGTSGDLSTRGAHRFKKAVSDVDEVFAIICTCWTGSEPS